MKGRTITEVTGLGKNSCKFYHLQKDRKFSFELKKFKGEDKDVLVQFEGIKEPVFIPKWGIEICEAEEVIDTQFLMVIAEAISQADKVVFVDGGKDKVLKRRFFTTRASIDEEHVYNGTNSLLMENLVYGVMLNLAQEGGKDIYCIHIEPKTENFCVITRGSQDGVKLPIASGYLNIQSYLDMIFDSKL